MDPRIVEIALQNLLSNALKYSSADSSVELQVRSAASGLVEFAVSDRGIGIPEPEMRQVVESFYRCSNVGDVQGTGLGLAIVKGCVDLHGGRLQIESEPGKGTCVRMCLPDWLQVRATREEVSV
jgi:signal transduction histidine kinase